MDITPYIRARSDQLNADDLLGGDITVQIEGVSKGNAEQPVVVQISGGHQAWKPGKTALRVLAAAWGTDASAWVGRWVTLYRDATVQWAGSEVGGIRVRALSHLDRPLTLSLAVSRGKKTAHKVGVIKAPKPTGAPTADLDALLADNELTRADVDRWLASKGKPLLAEVPADRIAALAVSLASKPALLAEVRAMVPVEDDPFGDGEVSDA